MTEGHTDTYHLLGNLVRFLARSSETGGAYCLVETLTAPGAGAPPNRHPADDEAFYVLEGSFAFEIDGKPVAGAPGAFVRVPNGAVHAFRNVGSLPGRLLIVNVPGKVHESFFTEAGEPMPPGARELPPPEGAPDVPRLLEIGRRNGMEFLIPVPGDHSNGPAG